MFRSKHIFKDLYQYVNEINEYTSCPAEPFIESKQIGGNTYNIQNKKQNSTIMKISFN